MMNILTPTPSTDCLSRREFSSVYPPAEDSFLFLDALESDVDFIRNRLKPALSIEVGSGSGIISAFLSKILGRACTYLCIDVSFQACLATKEVFNENNVRLLDSICGNLFSSLRLSSLGFADIVLFNPPYVPTEENELLDAKSTLTAAWAGGPKGRMVIDAFIKQVEPVLSKSGALYILLLRENDPDEVANLIKSVTNGRLSESKCVLQRQCGTEHLFVYRFYYPSVDPEIDMPTRLQSLNLFRALVKYIQSLEHTDQKYLLDRVKMEFRMSNEKNDDEYSEFLYEVRIFNLLSCNFNREERHC
ncbi:unnamed protein product [Rodentolepis nana]|uniref:Methyltransferase HEMK2 n=1 Tax=Rodentolepis nana TaxID=102285 RepID=A0A0R3SZY8_RODNA|nr:unnamed protein product [Rodentolepis nana]